MINVLISIAKPLNDLLRGEKRKRDQGNAFDKQIDNDLMRARFSRVRNMSFDWSDHAKQITRRGRLRQQNVIYVIESLYIENMQEFDVKVAAKKSKVEFEIIGAWEMDGRQYGQRWLYTIEPDGTQIKSGVTGSPVYPFDRAKYIAHCPDINVYDAQGSVVSTKTVAQALQDGDITELPQINLKANIQRNRLFT